MIEYVGFGLVLLFLVSVIWLVAALITSTKAGRIILDVLGILSIVYLLFVFLPFFIMPASGLDPEVAWIAGWIIAFSIASYGLGFLFALFPVLLSLRFGFRVIQSKIFK